MNTNFYTVIMTGGIGSRLWPLSTVEKPKQFCDVLSTGKSLLQHTFTNFNNLIPTDNILIATQKKYLQLTVEQLNTTSLNNILLEPVGKNTAPCILYSALKIYNQNPNAVIVVSPSDHWIKDSKKFTNSIAKALDFCSENSGIVTLGITPATPNTQYGYIEFKNSENSIKKVARFTKKPNKETAKIFVKEGKHLWNSGIFIFSAKSIIAEFKKYLPNVFSILSNTTSYNTVKENNFININYPKVESISIDYGILEKSENTYVLPVNFDWNDLGSWESLIKELPTDKDNNSYKNKSLFLDTKNTTTYSSKKVVIANVSNITVIEHNNTILIYSKEQKKPIKEISIKALQKFNN